MNYFLRRGPCLCHLIRISPVCVQWVKCTIAWAPYLNLCSHYHAYRPLINLQGNRKLNHTLCRTGYTAVIHISIDLVSINIILSLKLHTVNILNIYCLELYNLYKFYCRYDLIYYLQSNNILLYYFYSSTLFLQNGFYLFTLHFTYLFFRCGSEKYKSR